MSDSKQADSDPLQHPEAGDVASKQAINKNSVVSFHYRLCEEDSDGNRKEWMEDSFGGEPLVYLHGYKNVVSGLERNMQGKTAGDEITVTLQPAEAYGMRQPEATQRVPIKHLHMKSGQKKLLPGMIVSVQTSQGVRNVMVVKAGKFNVDVDFNHPLAGKILHYELTIVAVREASAEEVAHGHVHGAGGHHH